MRALASLYDPRRWPGDRLARFQAFIEAGQPGRCWPWHGSRSRRGLGRYRWREGGRTFSVYTPRMVWAIHRGPLSPEIEVALRCGNAGCCNLEHLVAGPPVVRARLLVQHGRSIAGSRHPGAMLTPAQVDEFRRLKREQPGLTGPELAARFGLRSVAWVNSILRGAGWRDPAAALPPAARPPARKQREAPTNRRR